MRLGGIRDGLGRHSMRGSVPPFDLAAFHESVLVEFRFTFRGGGTTLLRLFVSIYPSPP